MQTSPCNENPLTPHFYIVNWGIQNLIIFHLKIIIFTAVKTHCVLHGRVFVMMKVSEIMTHNVKGNKI